jgi:hypothetical protein
VPVAEEELRRILDGYEPALRHPKDADLVDAAEAILRRAEDAVIERGVPLEVKDGVDDVLERLRAGDASALRDVTDDEDGDASLLGEAHQTRGAFTHLADVARRSLEVGREDGLNRVDDEDRLLPRRRGREHRLEVGLRDELDVPRAVADAVRAQLDLKRGLLAGGI